MRGITILSLSLLTALASAAPVLDLVGECYTKKTFPSKDKWLEPQELWDKNLPALQKHNSQDEIWQIQQAILNKANYSDKELPKDNKPSGLDPRVIFAVMMRESTGNAHVGNHDGGVSRGLMQSNKGTSCYSEPSRKCSATEIWQMVDDGIFGSGGSEGLKKSYEGVKDSDPKDYNVKNEAQTIATALTRYNSGPDFPNVEDLSITWATPSYASDVGNILVGRTYPLTCEWPEPRNPLKEA